MKLKSALHMALGLPETPNEGKLHRTNSQQAKTRMKPIG